MNSAHFRIASTHSASATASGKTASRSQTFHNKSINCQINQLPHRQGPPESSIADSDDHVFRRESPEGPVSFVSEPGIQRPQNYRRAGCLRNQELPRPAGENPHSRKTLPQEQKPLSFRNNPANHSTSESRHQSSLGRIAATTPTQSSRQQDANPDLPAVKLLTLPPTNAPAHARTGVKNTPLPPPYSVPADKFAALPGELHPVPA